MFRFLVVFALCTFFSVASVAQNLRDEAAEPAPNNSDLHSRITPGPRFKGAAEARISVTRLREPRKAQELYNKALHGWRKGHFVEAQKQLDKALNIYPRFPEALTLYGCLQGSFQQWDSAEQKIQAAIRADPNFSPEYVVLAGIYNAQRRFDEAQQAIQQALSAGAGTWHIQYEIVRSLIGKRDYESALAAADAALRSMPDESLLHLAKAHALIGLRKYPQAAKELNTFLHYDPAGDGSEQARNLLQKIQRAASP
jgi:tetratricopeptide (TPR) repeat protein